MVLTSPSMSGVDLEQDYHAAIALRGHQLIYPFADGARNNHTPLSAVMFLPLSFLDFTQAFQIYSIASLSIFLLITYALMREYEIRASAALLITALISIWWPPYFNTKVGSQSLLIAALVGVAMPLLSKRWVGLASMSLAFATSLKIFPGLLALFLLTREGIRAFLHFLGWLILINLICMFVVGTTNFLAFPDVVSGYTQTDTALPINLSLEGLAEKFFGRATSYSTPMLDLGGKEQLLAWAAKLVIFCSLILLLLRRSGRSIEAFGATCSAMLLLSPSTWSHALSVLIIPIVLCFRGTSHRADMLLRCLMLALLSVPDLYLARMLAVRFGLPSGWASGLLVSLPAFGLLLSYLIFWRCEWKKSATLR